MKAQKKLDILPIFLTILYAGFMAFGIVKKARFWLNAQAAYDLEVAQDELQHTIERDVHPLTDSLQVSEV